MATFFTSIKPKTAAPRMALVVMALSAMTGSARAADLLYAFDLTGDFLTPFSFSFTVPDFVTSGQSPAFSPFTITNGTDSWVMTQDLAASQFGEGCFSFASAGGGVNNCGWSSGPNEGSFVVSLPGGLPTATGTYIFNLGFGDFEAPGFSVSPGFAGSVTISSVTTATPEPPTITLFGGIIAIWIFSRRSGRRPVPWTS